MLQKYKARPGDRVLFTSRDEVDVSFELVQAEVKSRPELHGIHIRAQLRELGLLEEFERGMTPDPLPFTLWEGDKSE